jgi:hypothetical protein
VRHDITYIEVAVYGKSVMNESSVRKWYGMFIEGRTNAYDE